MMSILRRVLGRASPDSPWISGTPVREELGMVHRLRGMDAAGQPREYPRAAPGGRYPASLDPYIPKAWPRFEMTVRCRLARYEILVENPDGVCRGIVATAVDGTAILRQPFGLKMQDDGITHHVLVRLG